MPKVEVNECDVFATRGDDVLETHVTIRRGADSGHMTFKVLLSLRAHNRLLAALGPPKTRNTAPKP